MDNKIYTKRGDKGETSLLGGTRVPKYHIRVEAYGTIDELKSYMALLIDYANDKPLNAIIKSIQEKLFRSEALVACEDEKIRAKLPQLVDDDVSFLEKEIDVMNAEMPPLNNFIIPGGNVFSAHAHVARCICRRAERIVIRLSEEDVVEPLVIQYLNRLSDYLFVLARFLCHTSSDCTDNLWKTRG